MTRWLQPPSSLSSPNAENDTSLEPEVALIVVTICEVVAKSREHIVELPGPDTDVMAYRYVEPAANDEVKRVIAWRTRSGTSSLAGLKQISVNIRVSSTKHRFNKGLVVHRPILEDGADVVCKQIAARNYVASRRTRTVWSGGK